MDIFLEQLVKHKKTTSDHVKIVLLTIATIVLTIAIFGAKFAFGLFHGVFGVESGDRKTAFGFEYLLIAGVWYGYYLILNMFNVEYEYILTNEEMDIDKILSKKGRKHVTNINFREIEICAPANVGEYKSMAENTDGFAAVIDASGDRTADNVYFVDYHSGNGKCRVYFQPTEKMVDAIYKFNPRVIHK